MAIVYGILGLFLGLVGGLILLILIRWSVISSTFLACVATVILTAVFWSEYLTTVAFTCGVLYGATFIMCVLSEFNRQLNSK